MLRAMKHFPLILLLSAVVGAQDGPKPETMSLLRKPLYAAAIPAETRVRLEANLATAKAEFDKDPDNVDAAIWLGRRTAYLARFRDAIAIYSAAIAKHPADPRLYRHRGHRYITVREFDNAIADLTKAASLVANRDDEVEPDGQPNARNIPTGTLKTNIYYHLGLAHYLKGDFERAADAYRLCMQNSKNADMQVATAHWQYMTLRRLNHGEEAKKLLEPFTATMDVFENGSYHKLVLMYKGEIPEDALMDLVKKGGLDAATVGYGVANWRLYNGRSADALALVTDIIQQNASQWTAFGYIAAEAEFARWNFYRQGRR